YFVGPTGCARRAVASADELELVRTLGAHHGRIHGGDPWRMAAAHDIPVTCVSRAAIEAERPPREGKQVLGYIVYGQPHAGDGPYAQAPRIFIDKTLSAADQTETLAHELGHWQFPQASDEAAEEWGQAFLRAAVGRRVAA